MAGPGNAINETTTGICGFTGTGFTGTAATQHAVLVGGATSSTLTNLSVGATGTVLAGSTGADPAFTATPSVTSITFGSGSALSTFTDWTTWTPTITGGSTAGVTTYTIQAGFYSRIGNVVFIQWRVNFSAATGTGNMVLGGLPFTIANVSNNLPEGAGYLGGITFPASTTHISFEGQTNTTTILPIASGSAQSAAVVQMANVAGLVIGSMCYRV